MCATSSVVAHFRKADLIINLHILQQLPLAATQQTESAMRFVALVLPLENLADPQKTRARQFVIRQFVN